MAPRCPYCQHPVWGRVYLYAGTLTYHPICFWKLEQEFRQKQDTKQPETKSKTEEL